MWLCAWWITIVLDCLFCDLLCLVCHFNQKNYSQMTCLGWQLAFIDTVSGVSFYSQCINRCLLIMFMCVQSFNGWNCMQAQLISERLGFFAPLSALLTTLFKKSIWCTSTFHDLTSPSCFSWSITYIYIVVCRLLCRFNGFQLSLTPGFLLACTPHLR